MARSLKYCLLAVLFMNCFHATLAQDTLFIEETIVEASYIDLHSTAFSEKTDSFLLYANRYAAVDQILNLQTSAIIKTYGGLGNLSTIQLRGTGANGTSVNWNGFPVNSVTTGSSDISFISAHLFDEIALNPGASSSIFGSGTFGGALQLNNSVQFNKGLSFGVSAELGSFETNNYSGDFQFSNKTFDYSIAMAFKKAKNNFEYIDKYKPGNPKEERIHNATESSALIQNLHIKLKNNTIIETGIWYAIKEKEIPELAGSYGESYKFQKDSSFKTYFKVKKQFYKSVFHLNAAYFDDFLKYTDKLNDVDTEYSIFSKFRGTKIIGNAMYRRYFKNLSLDAVFVTEHLKAESLNYPGKIPQETDFAFIGAARFQTTKSQIHLNLRNEWSKTTAYTPLFEFAFRQKLPIHIQAKIRASNKFRKPTFNEKYWEPGGNTSLKNEKGEAVELSLEHIKNISREKKVYHAICIYGTQIKNMINWIPDGSIWKPVNIATMKIWGLEAKAQRVFNYTSVNIKFQSSYSYTNSKLFDSNFTGKQFIYTPFHVNKTNFFVTWRKLTLVYTFLVNGKRFTTYDNNPNLVLNPYTVSNIFVNLKHSLKNFHIDCSIRFLNIFNEDYEVIRSYPSPGRSVYLNLSIQFNKTIKNESI